VRRWIDRQRPESLGGFYELALYCINFYGFNAFSPWFAEQRDWASIASHFAFGAVLACARTAINTDQFTGPDQASDTSPAR